MSPSPPSATMPPASRKTAPSLGGVAVGLPGAGSDAAFVREVFEPALEARGIRLVAVDPDPGAVRASYTAALDEAAHNAGKVLVCGISIGSHIGAQWASEHQDQCLGLLACLPAWLGDPTGAAAAENAKHTAALLREQGLEASLRMLWAGSPPWVAQRLDRSWRAQWPKLPEAFDEIAKTALPTTGELRSLRLPVVVGAVDHDPFHPVGIAHRWHAETPNAALVTLAFAELAVNPAKLGHAALEAFGRLSEAAVSEK